MKKNIARFVLASTVVDPHETAVWEPENKLSRSELLTAVRDRANDLSRQGVVADEFVVVLCGRGTPFWIDLLALWVIGAKAVCLEESVQSDHGENVVALTAATKISADGIECPDCFAGLVQLRATTSESGELPSATTPDDLPFVDDEALPEMAALIFTSGTTGLPKGVPLTHEQLVMNVLCTNTRVQLRPTDRMMVATPFRFMSAICHFLVTMMVGASFYGVEDKMMIKDLLDATAAAEVTAFGGSPFHLGFIAMAGHERLPDLRWAMSSGDHLPVKTIDLFSTNFPDLELHVFYGMVEVGGRMCSLPPDALTEKKGSVGLPIPGLHVRIYDDDGEPARPGEIGDLYVDGDYGFKGYLSNEAATAAVLSERGFHTGDKGYRDEDGYLFLTGRSDSVFKRSGLKVSAQVITDEIGVLGVYSDVWVGSRVDEIEGRVPVTYFVVDGEPPERADVIRLLREKLPANHIPADFVQVPSIPRTGSGKVDRRAINALVESLGQTS